MCFAEKPPNWYYVYLIHFDPRQAQGSDKYLPALYVFWVHKPVRPGAMPCSPTTLQQGWWDFSFFSVTRRKLQTPGNAEEHKKQKNTYNQPNRPNRQTSQTKHQVDVWRAAWTRYHLHQHEHIHLPTAESQRGWTCSPESTHVRCMYIMHTAHACVVSCLTVRRKPQRRDKEGQSTKERRIFKMNEQHHHTHEAVIQVSLNDHRFHICISFSHGRGQVVK